MAATGRRVRQGGQSIPFFLLHGLSSGGGSQLPVPGSQPQAAHSTPGPGLFPRLMPLGPGALLLVEFPFYPCLLSPISLEPRRLS